MYKHPNIARFNVSGRPQEKMAPVRRPRANIFLYLLRGIQLVSGLFSLIGALIMLQVPSRAASHRVGTVAWTLCGTFNYVGSCI